MKLATMTWINEFRLSCAWALVVAIGVAAGGAGAEGVSPPTPEGAPVASTPVASTPVISAPVVAAPAAALADPRPVLERWAQAVAQRLAQTDPNALPVAPPVGPGARLKPGAGGERVDRLAAQLVARGFLPSGAYHGLYDLAVEAAVAAFQTNEGIFADGLAGEATVESLDRNAAGTVQALSSAVEGMRSLAVVAPEEFFLVNIPSQTAYLIQGNKIAMSMRAAVGRPSRPTPLLTDQVTDVVINPTWTAPTTVLAKDKLPSLRRTGHPGIEDATIYVDHVEVDPATVDWTTVTPDRVRIVQSPGDQNALGRFKFNLTNGQSIYMHDTNDHSVFARQGRALSSGCVRLAAPRQLAETLLGRDGWTPERIDHALDSERTQYISLRHPLPVRFVYWQAIVDDAGVVRVQRDIYGQNTHQVRTAAVRHSPAAGLSAPHQLIVRRSVARVPLAPAVSAPVPVAAGPVPESAGLLEQIFTNVMAYMPEPPTLPAAGEIKLFPGVQSEQVAVQGAASPSEGAHCTDKCGWGLY